MIQTWKEGFTSRLRSRDAVTGLLCSAACWFFTLLYLELLLHIAAFGAPDLRFGFVLGFTFVFACALALLTSFLPRKAQFPLTFVLHLLCILVYGSQMVYFFIFGTLYSVAQIQQGGAAITSFWKETLLHMWNNLPWLLALFVPLILQLLLRKRLPGKTAANGVWRVILAVCAVLVYILCVACLPIGGTDHFSNYDFYHSASTTTDQAAERFGLLTAFRLDILGTGDTVQTDVPDDPYYVPVTTTAPTQPSGSDPQETTPVTEPTVAYNVLELDFNALNGMTDDEKIIALNNYCASLTGTNQNEYTGMLSDYNLILLCAESFATGAIDPELTPTLYRLANEGFVFTNFYNTFPNNTTDGEYTFCMGLYPDTSRGKEASSFYASRNSYLPYCLGNVFSQQLGIQAYGYHNYSGSYYGRKLSHPNMGYSMKFAKSGMTFTTDWPSSDLEMMEQSIDDYIGQEQFHAYYMTFSGHLAYHPQVNPMAERNWDAVEDLPYSRKARSYLSCNIELDKALAYLMQRLEEEGVADKTAIVLAGDHFPYGLGDSDYSQLIGYTVDDFTKYKSTLIFWVGGMEESIVVDEYCCNADILPTILNLWGFTYDSRMLAGTDVFSDGTHIAILSDMSFYTDKVWLNASSGEIRYLVEESQLPEGYVESMIRLVKTKHAISTDILNTAYYNFIFEKGNVDLNDKSWQPKPAPEPDPEPAETVPPSPEAPTEAPEVPPETPTEAPEMPTDAPETPTEAPSAPEPTEPVETPSAPAEEPTEAPQVSDPPADTATQPPSEYTAPSTPAQ